MEYPKIKINQGFVEVDGQRIDTVLSLDAHYEGGKAGLAEVTMKIYAETDIEGTAEVKKITDEVKNNTVTQQQIDDLFDKAEKKIEKYWNKCTVMTVQLPNEFTLVEHSACVDPKNYDEKIGIEICERKIKDKLWELEGYKLQCQLGKLK